MMLDVDVTASRGTFRVEAAFAADPGETVAVLGPNGAGKSTLVDVLAGVVAPDRGRVVLDGVELDGSQSKIGVMFQGLRLLPHLSVLENVAFPLRARGVRAADARTQARGMLRRVGAADLAGSKPRALSGGEAQRVALARALIGAPDLLVLDEPLSALDVSARTELRELLRRVLEAFAGAGVLITHDPVDAMTLADRIVILEEGHVTQSGTPDEIRAAPRTPYAADLVGVNVFSGRLVHSPDGTAVILGSTGAVACVPPPEMPPGTEVLGVVRPADVSLHITEPEGSPRNVFEGAVRFVSTDAERARVGIASSPPVVAEVTNPSVAKLGLAEGTHVWASFKALEVRVVAS